jgi:hypothetical protein
MAQLLLLGVVMLVKREQDSLREWILNQSLKLEGEEGCRTEQLDGTQVLILGLRRISPENQNAQGNRSYGPLAPNKWDVTSLHALQEQKRI